MKRKVTILIIIAALVLCLIPAPVLADDDDTVTDLEFTIEVPDCHTLVEGYDWVGTTNRQRPQPKVTLPADSVFVLAGSEDGNYAAWMYLKKGEVDSLQYFHDDYMTGGNSYYAKIYFKYFGTKSVSQDLNVTVRGGEVFEELGEKIGVIEFSGYWSIYVTVKVDVEHEFSEWETDPDSYTHATTEAPGIHIDRRTCSLCGETEEKTIVDEEQLPPEPKPTAPDTGDGDSFIMLMLELCAAVLACIMIRQIGKSRKMMNGRK